VFYQKWQSNWIWLGLSHLPFGFPEQKIKIWELKRKINFFSRSFSRIYPRFWITSKAWFLQWIKTFTNYKIWFEGDSWKNSLIVFWGGVKIELAYLSYCRGNEHFLRWIPNLGFWWRKAKIGTNPQDHKWKKWLRGGKSRRHIMINKNYVVALK